ncbi:MAG: hypothetical protein QNJ85_17580 [Gammaproteobacteria bacterium]|nr:hypothetical protein [Gammaproteobacteria bacterium]
MLAGYARHHRRDVDPGGGFFGHGFTAQPPEPDTHALQALLLTR